MHCSLGPPEFTSQKASRSVQPFLQGSRLSQTDYATPSDTVGRISYCNVYLYQSTNFLNSPCDISELYRADTVEFVKNINLFDEL